MLRAFLVLVLCLGLMPFAAPYAAAQETQETIDRSATGGAQTLEDILARQRGEEVAPKTGDAASKARDLSGQLGTLGGSSDPDLWRALRYGSADITVSSGGEVATVLVQDGGMGWLEFRKGPLATYGGYLLLGTIALLLVFFVLRGKVKLDYEKTGRTVTRFKSFERAAHWLLAGSFILLGITGLLTLFGRMFIAPYISKEFNATLLMVSKYIHNNVAWAFMVALVAIFVMWVWHNIPNRTDITWFAQAGGIVGSKHPPAKKFNGGQKIIFWSVILLGGSISLSGVSLLFPFEFPMFMKTFDLMRSVGIESLPIYGPLPTAMAPHEEMQYAQAWHAIVAFVLMAIIIAHIYIGSVGMEGAYDAMGSGEVDEAWARQHHSLWLEELQAKDKAAPKDATPAE
ncbi:formate dehydrogenase subunit gamma [Tateyamaria sp. ANG-S1]|uniref:formate dehydrogenase subunit gamma n=1 Tax=Tateyamaria sp. ANG-S1 TaxID=1577905 RepID=UPI00057D210E|nr:formate dehydrogenase subunit gamma [Tateyamaria sp. ANG-S1]KIC45588.1 formate dehydrogenase [Tateyamaria sp. ANG-S1]